MHRLAILLIVILGATAPIVAVSPEEIVAMKKVGVSDTVLLALIERDQTIYSLDAKDLAELQRQGISERVILAMVHSGRDEHPGTAPATAVAAAPAAPSDPGAFAVVGHGPDSPGGAVPAYMMTPGYYGGADYYAPGGYYGIVPPFFFPGIAGRRPHARRDGVQVLPANPSGPFLNDPMRRFENSIVTIPPPPPHAKHGG